MGLIAHLGDDAGLAGDLSENPVLPQGAHERLLHVAVKTELHRRNGNRRMHMVGRRDRDGIDVTLFAFEHLAPVGITAHLGRIAAQLLKLCK